MVAVEAPGESGTSFHRKMVEMGLAGNQTTNRKEIENEEGR